MNRNFAPLVSVVIPTFGRPKLLGRAVESVAKQTYENLEIIVVDDNEESHLKIETKRIVDTLRTVRDIRLVNNTRNIGGSASRNRGIQFSSGQYIAFLDDDDEWLPGKIEKQMDVFFSGRTNKLGVVYCGSLIKNAGSGEIQSRKFKKVRGDFRKEILFDNFVVTTSAVIIRKYLLRRVQGFDETLLSSQDWDLLIRLSNECEIDYCDELLVTFHDHSKRISNDIRRKLITFEKYESKVMEYSHGFSFFVRSKILGLYNFRMGHQLMKFGERRRAIGYLGKSFFKYPLNIMTVADLILALFPTRLYRALIKLKNALIEDVEAR